MSTTSTTSRGYQWVPLGTSGYREYQEDQDQISGATYISDDVFVINSYNICREMNIDFWPGDMDSNFLCPGRFYTQEDRALGEMDNIKMEIIRVLQSEIQLETEAPILI